MGDEGAFAPRSEADRSRVESRVERKTDGSVEASSKKDRGTWKRGWTRGRGAKLLGDFASYLISPETLLCSTASPFPFDSFYSSKRPPLLSFLPPDPPPCHDMPGLPVPSPRLPL